MGLRGPKVHRYERQMNWHPDREQLAWAAGFVDGEGSFYSQQFRTKNGKPFCVSSGGQRVHFEIGQTNLPLLERFRLVTGFGHPVNGPYDATKHGAKQVAKPFWVFRLSGFENVQTLMALLWIWLGPVKREQAISALNRSIA